MAEMRKNKRLTPKEASITINKPVSQWTARRAIHNIDYISDVKQSNPASSDKNVIARLNFAREQKNWTVDDWKHNIWSDE